MCYLNILLKGLLITTETFFVVPGVVPGTYIDL